ncbi:transcription factor IIIB 90 kDa subunit [Platysternon megacephalum]|uniref:Transcription factor IIIB 90 kDa subunit n=1 Tax=Platysternon megacephalum TaxID=55544 RepID=A0A4D9F044_9SAUR|nr:transcription factor IIIB 90 kDa subunit [Platysternon megacephalum]
MHCNNTTLPPWSDSLSATPSRARREASALDRGSSASPRHRRGFSAHLGVSAGSVPVRAVQRRARPGRWRVRPSATAGQAGEPAGFPDGMGGAACAPARLPPWAHLTRLLPGASARSLPLAAGPAPSRLPVPGARLVTQSGAQAPAALASPAERREEEPRRQRAEEEAEPGRKRLSGLRLGNGESAAWDWAGVLQL